MDYQEFKEKLLKNGGTFSNQPYFGGQAFIHNDITFILDDRYGQTIYLNKQESKEFIRLMVLNTHIIKQTPGYSLVQLSINDFFDLKF